MERFGAELRLFWREITAGRCGIVLRNAFNISGKKTHTESKENKSM